MSKYKFSSLERYSLWIAYDKKCFYSDVPLSFKDVEIDHLIPESIKESSSKFLELKKSLDLGEDFGINTFYNWVPTHPKYNKKKRSNLFSTNNLRFYLEQVKTKQPSIIREFEKLSRSGANEKIFAQLKVKIEQGDLTKEEIFAFVKNISLMSESVVSEPIVVCFGINIFDLREANGIPSEAPDEYPLLCDWFEEKLKESFLKLENVVSIQTEASARNGETMSIRFAFWYLNFQKLEFSLFSPWDILEIVPYSALYDEPPGNLYEPEANHGSK